MAERCPPVSLINWPVYGLKVGLVSILAYLLDGAFHLNDAVSAGFVAVVCISPTLFTGMKRATAQIAGSVLGGLIATLFLLMGLKGALAIGLAVGLSAALAGFLKMEQANVVAAFAALYVVILGEATPSVSSLKHLGAVAIAGLSATLVNFLVSALFYRVLFARRIGILREQLAWTFERAGEGDDTFDVAFAMIGAVESELDDASREKRRKRIEEMLRRCQDEVAILKDLAHYGKDALLQGNNAAFKAISETIRGKGLPPEGEQPLATTIRRWSRQTKAATEGRCS
ncbi:MAG TPA: aromatic acid exporter family protein [Chroococcales cyanobacterium]